MEAMSGVPKIKKSQSIKRSKTSDIKTERQKSIYSTFSPSPTKMKLDVIREENTLQTEEDEHKEIIPFKKAKSTVVYADIDQETPEEKEEQRIRRRPKRLNDVDLDIDADADLEKGTPQPFVSREMEMLASMSRQLTDQKLKKQTSKLIKRSTSIKSSKSSEPESPAQTDATSESSQIKKNLLKNMRSKMFGAQ